MSKGYSLAVKGRRFVKRVSKQQCEGREKVRTEPGTVQHQDFLARHRYAGEFFFGTRGGGILNMSDLFLGYKREIIKEDAKILQKVKDVLTEADELAEKYNNLIRSKGIWRKPDYLTAIKRHHGTNIPPESEKKINTFGLKRLKEIYDEKYKDSPPPESQKWTPVLESELQRLNKGEVNTFQETSIYGNALGKNEEYLFLRLQSVSMETKLRVLKKY